MKEACMEHQGMLLFLSDVKVRDGKVRVTNYKDIGDCYTTNESAVRYCIQENKTLERLFAFATQKVQSTLKDENTKEAYCDEDGNPYTHLSYFEYRLRQGEHPIEAELEVASYNEEGEMNENIQSIVDMAAKVDAFIAGLPKEDTLVLHADSTGGMRNAAMVTMAILRLMQYDDRVRIGDILYSNWNKHIVEKVNDIYALFDLIAGAEEFVRFGSVQTLRDYYKRQAMSKQSPELRQLIKAMADFSDAISLCNYGTFRDAITNLRRTMEDFHGRMNDANGEASLPDSLMNRLYGRIRHEYRWLLRSEEPDDITLIEWCIQHDYIQQALTLYTERVPEIFASCRLAEITEAGKPFFEYQFSQDKTTTEAFQLYTLFRDKEWEAVAQTFVDEKRAKTYCKLLKQEIKDLVPMARNDQKTDFASQAVCRVEAYIKDISSEVDTGLVVLDDGDGLKKGFALLQQLCRTPGKVMTGDFPFTRGEQGKLKVLKEAYLSATKQEHAEFETLKSYVQGKKIADWANQMKSQDILAFFSDISNAYSNRFIRLKERGWIRCDLPDSKLRLLLERYGTIKDERNHTNHARNDRQPATLDDIKVLLTDGLQEIRKFVVHS